MRKIASKCIPHELTDMHKWARAGRCSITPPPYSPDISPCNYDLIPKMKMPMCGKRYHTTEDVKQAAKRSLCTINRFGNANRIQ
ncbi:hypothetical protein C0J52_14178 [Blattella germanica]|nr:hypothetical protein C0J52_14178 [Blattella germanica]